MPLQVYVFYCNEGGLISSLLLADFDSAMALITIDYREPKILTCSLLSYVFELSLFCCIIHCCFDVTGEESTIP
jgi:hypothetical protein